MHQANVQDKRTTCTNQHSQSLLRQNFRWARKTWGTVFGSQAKVSLETLTRQFSFSLNGGDLQIINSNWYVTHTGLIGLARRKRCCGINVEATNSLCDSTASRFVLKATVYPSKNSSGFVGYGDADPFPLASDPFLALAKLRMRSDRKASEQKKSQTDQEDRKWVEQATADTYTWVTRYTKTCNEHWVEEGRPSPLEPFPADEYFSDVFDIMDLDERVIWWEKSRDIMLSWACVAHFELHAMKTPYCGFLFQTQKDTKVIQLVDYAKHLWRNSGERIQRAFPRRNRSNASLTTN